MLKQKHKENDRFYAVLALALCAALLVACVSDYFVRCRLLRTEVLRLHITANSDSKEDQAVKLLVRDALLQAGAEQFRGAATADEARNALQPLLSELEATAERVLREAGFTYGAKAYFCEEYFDARSYGELTFPAGKYAALRVALGTGEGHNWWCVMFPPLCLPAAEADDGAYAFFDGDSREIVRAEGGYRIRFRIVELAEELWKKLTG